MRHTLFAHLALLALPAVAAAMGTGFAASAGGGWEFAAATGGFARLIRP